MSGRLLAGLAAALLLLGATPIASAAEAASITAVGWWSQRPGAGELPEGGFEVALAPSGPLSEAALRIDVSAAQLTSALLELTESSQVLADVAGVQACPTDDPWSPANPGAWSDAHAPNCEGPAVSLGRNADGTWTGDIRPLLRAGTVSIVLVPLAEFSEQQQSVAFQLVFEKAELTAAAAGAEAGPSQADPVVPPSPPTSFDSPDLAPAPAAPARLPTPVGTSPGVTAATPSPRSVTQAAPEADADSKPWWRLLFGIPLSALAGAGAVLARRTLQHRRIIGA